MKKKQNGRVFFAFWGFEKEKMAVQKRIVSLKKEGKKTPRLCFFLLVFWAQFLTFSLAAQSPNSLIINVLESETPFFDRFFEQKKWAEKGLQKKLDGQFACPSADSLAAENLLLEIVENLRRDGHFLASADSIFFEKKPMSATLRAGQKFEWAALEADSATSVLIEKMGLERSFFSAQKRPAEITDFEKKILQLLENQGFAFARVWLEDFKTDEKTGQIAAKIRVWTGPQSTFAGIRTEGEIKISSGYLEQFLGIRRGEPFSRERVLAVSKTMRSSPVAELSGSPFVTFRGTAATVNLLLKKRKTSRFDVLFGLLPRSDRPGSALLTGQATLELANALGQGERLFLDWQRLRPETQRLDLAASFPFILGQPFGFEAAGKLFKRDSTFVETAGELGGQYFFGGQDFVKIFWERRGANLLKINELAIKTNRRLPENLDSRANSFGLETAFSRLDHRLNPRRGWSIKTRLGAGFRATPRSDDLLEIGEKIGADFAAAYDSLGQRAAFGRGNFGVEKFFPFQKRATFLLAARGGGLFSKKPILQNEQFRLGGARSLRGFDEESIFATRWLAATAEARLLIGENSHLAAFADAGYVENLTVQKRQFLRPVGLGAGGRFETSAGILSLVFAVGRAENAGFDFRAVKVHVGFLSLF